MLREYVNAAWFLTSSYLDPLLLQILAATIIRKLCSQLSVESVVKVKNIMRMVFSYGNGDKEDTSDTLAPYRHCRDWDILATTITKKKLIPTPTFFKKCVDVDEALSFGSGVVIVGEPGSYKSTIIDVMVSAFNRGLGGEEFTLDNARTQRLYPTVHSFEELFGSHDDVTGSWHDGVFSRTIRVLSDIEMQEVCDSDALYIASVRFVLHLPYSPNLPLESNHKPHCVWLRQVTEEQESSKHTWTVFDGTVTSRWSDALISCLKPERRLCLPSGEVLGFPRTSRLIFEAPSLQNASPHIVGACYVVCMSPSLFPAPVILENWCSRLPKLLSPFCGELIELYEGLFVVSSCWLFIFCFTMFSIFFLPPYKCNPNSRVHSTS